MPAFYDDSKKSTYLSYRATGFTIRESVEFVGVTERTLRNWRRYDPEFARWDREALGELRQKLGDRYLEIEFRRNYRLILQKDYDVIKKSVEDKEPLTYQESQYLLKARSHYTPQQLETIERILSGSEGGGEEFDWTSFVLSLRGRGGEVHIAARRGEIE
jgi:hypothetical protein